MKIDRMKMKSNVHQVAAELRALKRHIRGKEAASAKEWSALAALKARATRLYMLLAHARRRIHRQGATWEEQTAELAADAATTPELHAAA